MNKLYFSNTATSAYRHQIFSVCVISTPYPQVKLSWRAWFMNVIASYDWK